MKEGAANTSSTNQSNLCQFASKFSAHEFSFQAHYFIFKFKFQVALFFFPARGKSNYFRSHEQDKQKVSQLINTSPECLMQILSYVIASQVARWWL